MIQIYRQITDHFQYTDFECPCCSELLLTPLFFRHIERLEELRQILGFPLDINSGHRCINHNTAVGGKVHSMHLKFATDVRPTWPAGQNGDEFLSRVDALYDEAKALGFMGLGKYSTFVHLDLRDGKLAEWTG